MFTIRMAWGAKWHGCRLRHGARNRLLTGVAGRSIGRDQRSVPELWTTREREARAHEAAMNVPLPHAASLQFRHPRLVTPLRLGLMLGSLLVGPTPGLTQSVRTDLFVTNGQVSAVAELGGTIYVGGDFTLVGPSTGS